MNKVLKARGLFGLLRREKHQWKSGQKDSAARPQFDQTLLSLVQNVPSLTELNMAGKQLDCPMLQRLANHLLRNDFVTTLDLSNNALGNEGAELVGGFLPLLPALKNVVLRANHIGCLGVVPLLCGKGDGGRDSAVTTLHLDKNHVCEHDTSNPGLPWHSYDDMYQAIRDVAYALSINHYLTRLSLSGNRIGDDGLKCLGGGICQQSTGALRHLDLSQNEITDKGVAALVPFLIKSQRIAHLNLSANMDLTDASASRLLAAIAPMKRMEQCQLESTRVSKKLQLQVTNAMQQHLHSRKVRQQVHGGRHLGSVDDGLGQMFHPDRIKTTTQGQQKENPLTAMAVKEHYEDEARRKHKAAAIAAGKEPDQFDV